MAPVAEGYYQQHGGSQDSFRNGNGGMNGSAGMENGFGKANTVLFDTTKNELFRLTEGFKTLHRKLKGNWKVSSNREGRTKFIFRIFLRLTYFGGILF